MADLETTVESNPSDRKDIPPPSLPKKIDTYFCRTCRTQEGNPAYRQEQGRFLPYCTSCGEEVSQAK